MGTADGYTYSTLTDGDPNLAHIILSTGSQYKVKVWGC